MLDLLNNDPTEHGCGRSRKGVDERDGRESVGAQGRTGVETEPTEPQQCHTEKSQRNVVWLGDALRESKALAQN